MQSVPQIRSSQVNISQQQQQQQQQQRHAAAAAPTSQGTIPGGSVPAHLMLQAQQARVIAQLQAQAQAQAQTQPQPQAQIQVLPQVQNQSSQVPLATRLSPSFSNQVPISPGLQSASPPRPNSMHGRGSSSPRPPSAQRNASMAGPVTHVQIPGNQISRQNNVQTAYFPTGQLGVTQDQLQMLRLQMLNQVREGCNILTE